MNDPKVIRGKSLLKNPIETDLTIIQKNKNTILHSICCPEGIPEGRVPKNTVPKNRVPEGIPTPHSNTDS